VRAFLISFAVFLGLTVGWGKAANKLLHREYRQGWTL
jgi:hypothetical protein